MKKIMLLGGNYFQMTATKAAKELGCHVISVDYLPENPAHKFADEYCNVSTTDKDNILKLAEKLGIDGIVSYASDVSAPTAAYVAEKMGLPTNPYESVLLMTRKDMFRDFLKRNGFYVPEGKSFKSEDEIEAYEFFVSLDKPVMIKPVDASGSKGASKVYENGEFKKAFELAATYSNAGLVIVEGFMEREGYQVAGDGFIVNGNLKFTGLMNEHFDIKCNPLVPIGESYPSILNEGLKEKAINEIQKLITSLDMKMGAINLDFIINKEGRVCVLEIGPRNGGNLITDAIKESNGIDLAKYTIKAALGMDCSELHQKEAVEYISTYIVHSKNSGYYSGMLLDPEIEKDIIREKLFIEKGNSVIKFDNASFGIGAMIIRHKNIDEMCYRMDHMDEFIKINVR
jgi:biotin carboxylase